MYDAVLRIIRLGISIGEVWLCYQLMYLMILEKEYLRKKDKVIIWGNILILGYLLEVNRSVSFFSHVMFLFCIIVTISCVWIVNRKVLLLIFSVVFLYYTLISLMDFVFAFISMELLQQNFTNMVFVRAETWWPLIIYLFSRLLIGGGIFYLYKKIEDISKVVKEFCNIMLGIGGILAILLRKYQIMMDQMIQNDQEMHGVASSLSLLFVATIIIIGGILLFQYKSLKKEREVLLFRDKMMEEKYQEMMKSHHAIHDMKNHLIVLRNYEEEKEWSKLHIYLEDISRELMNTSSHVWTGNMMIDLILNQKSIEAREKGIKMNILTVPVSGFPCTDREIISLFGNLLDNAIEACGRMVINDTWINLKIEKQNHMLFIEIANSIGEMPRCKNGEFITSKKDVRSHGYGLKSVERIVHRHDGTITCQVESSQFVVEISFFDNVSS